ncbi:MAG TPA: hypothetical protein VLV29_06280 [Steroidobacteraceae bacterium]|nr:hypothetical protein [Steroidobacteraceae bacterium]
MSSARGVVPLLCAAACLLLGSCAGSRTSATAPAGLSLAGTWRLDPAASDDPQKILSRMRAQALKIINRNLAQTQARVDSGSAPPETAAVIDPSALRRDPLARSTAAHIIKDVIARGELLTIRQSPDQIVFDFGTSRRSFTPGAHSVVSAEGGVGDQRSGWSGHGYLIVIKAQQGPEVTDAFDLSADGAQLVEKLHIGSYELPAVDLKRVYDRTSDATPHQLPTSD